MGRIESEKLASIVESQTGADDVFDTAIPSIKLSRFSAPSELSALVYEPCLCIVAQGAKEVVLAGERYRLDPAQSLLVSVDLPVEARVVEATADCPYLGIRISLDPAVVGELLADGATIQPLGPPARAIAVTPIDPPLIEAVTRLVTLLGALAPWSPRNHISPSHRAARSPAPSDRFGRSPRPSDSKGDPVAKGQLRGAFTD